MSIIEKILKLFKVKKNSNQKKNKVLTLFNTKEYNRPGYINYKKCPHCGLEGNTNEEIRAIFGLINSSNHTYIQSWCKECRKESVSKEKVKGRDGSLFEEIT